MNTNVAPLDSELPDAFAESVFVALLDSLDKNAKTLASELGLDWDAAMESKSNQHTPARQALTISKLGLFDEAYYLQSYPDILAAGLHPLTHYVNFGDAEGRRPNAVFDPIFYRTQFESKKPLSVAALYHYAVLGEQIGLKASVSFSPRRYLLSNEKLQPWLTKSLTHFLHLGKRQGLMVNHRARLSSAQTITANKISLPVAVGKVDPAAGLNIIGPLDRVSGLGVSARGYLDGLRKAGLTKIGCQVQQREFAIQTSIDSAPSYPAFLHAGTVNIVHMNGDTLPVMMQHGGDQLLSGRYNVAVWYWELPTLRPEWHASMKYFHEFWAPTPFIYRLLKQSTAKPVRLIPPYLGYLQDLERFEKSAQDVTGFVYCFDANSILERKNPGALLEAFESAFPKDSNASVKLTFKITYPNRKIPEVNRLYEAAAHDTRITIIDHLLSDADLHKLIGTASAYVSPHRSEGLGLTVVEAMGAGVPVISTPFGGIDAFVDPSTAYPIDYRLIELAGDYVPYPRGFVWADPDVASMSRQLSAVHNDKDEASRRAQLARQKVLAYFCSPELIESYKSELERISSL